MDISYKPVDIYNAGVNIYIYNGYQLQRISIMQGLNIYIMDIGYKPEDIYNAGVNIYIMDISYRGYL